MGASFLRRWWWLPTGLLVGVTIAALIDSVVVWVGMAIYLPVNLLGTWMILTELNDHESGPRWRPDRWRLAVELAFVAQLPVGALVVVVGGT